MSKSKALAAATMLAAGLSTTPSVTAQAPSDVIRIGFITDLSGHYEEVDGRAGGEAIKMAVADMGGVVAGKRVEVLVADHKNDVAIAAATARDWFDNQKLDLLIGGVNSNTGLAMADIATEKRRPFIAVGSGTSEHTNERCSPYVIQWAYDTVAQGRVVGDGVTRRGGRSWYMLTADYPFGAQLRDAATAAVRKAGGTVVGSALHPHEAEDFTPLLRQVGASKAAVLGLANGHTDLVNAIKAARSLDLMPGVQIAGTFVFITEIRALGLEAAQGMFVADSWFWTRDAESMAWSRRFFERFKRMPSSLQVADYSAALQYLKGVTSAGTTDAETVLQQLKQMKIDDVFAKGGYIRDDGRMAHDMYLLQVKSPEQSGEPWDYYNLVDVIEGEAAWTTINESRCALWK